MTNSNKDNIEDLFKVQNEYYLKGQDEEREIVAKDLHDGTSGVLYGLKLQLNHLKNNPTKLVSIIEDIDKQINRLSLEIKNITKKISPLNVKNFGLVPSMKELLLESTYNGINFVFNSNIESKRFNGFIEINLFRIFQECLSNILKHSKATNVEINFFLKNKKIILQITDNGKGLNIIESNKGNGLSNLFYRTQVLGGNIDISSKTNKGVSINITLNYDSKK